MGNEVSWDTGSTPAKPDPWAPGTSTQGGEKGGDIEYEEPVVEDECDWLQAVLEGLWPQIKPRAEKCLVWTLSQWSTSTNAGFAIDSLKLGQGLPSVCPTRVSQVADRVILAEVEFAFSSAAHIPVSFEENGRVEVCHMEVSGTLTVVARPLVPRAPWVGMLQLYFVQEPKLQVQVNDGTIQGDDAEANLEKAVGNLMEFVRQRSVVPHAMLVDIDPTLAPQECDIVTGSYVEPIGVARIHLVELLPDTAVWGSLKKELLVKVELRVGDSTWRSSTVGLDPERGFQWGPGGPAGFLLFSHLGQTVEISVIDDRPDSTGQSLCHRSISLMGLFSGDAETEEGHLQVRPRRGKGAACPAPVQDEPLPPETEDGPARGEGIAVLLKVNSEWMELTPPGRGAKHMLPSPCGGVLGVRVGIIEGISWPPMSLTAHAGLSSDSTLPGVPVGSPGPVWATASLAAAAIAHDEAAAAPTQEVWQAAGDPLEVPPTEAPTSQPGFEERIARKLAEQGWEAEDIAELVEVEPNVVRRLLGDNSADKESPDLLAPPRLATHAMYGAEKPPPQATRETAAPFIVPPTKPEAKSQSPGISNGVDGTDLPEQRVNDMLWLPVAGGATASTKMEMELRNAQGEALARASLPLLVALESKPAMWAFGVTSRGLQEWPSLCSDLFVELGFELWPCQEGTPNTARRGKAKTQMKVRQAATGGLDPHHIWAHAR